MQMTLADAEREFWLRVYVWAKAEWEREINESFLHLSLFKTDHAWNIYQFMLKLTKEERIAIVLGQLKRGHREATAAWGDELSGTEESLCNKLDAFELMQGQYRLFRRLSAERKIAEANMVFEIVCADAARVLFETNSLDAKYLSNRLDKFFSSIPQSFEEQVASKKQAGEKIRFVSKMKLQKTLTGMFKESFVGAYFGFISDDSKSDPWTSFDMKCCGWVLTTQFTFGRKQSQLSHRHIIQSKTRVQHPLNPTITGPAVTLGNAVVWPCGWHWECSMNGEMELACSETLKYCRYFYDAAPKLLKGLEFQNVTAN